MHAAPFPLQRKLCTCPLSNAQCTFHSLLMRTAMHAAPFPPLQRKLCTCPFSNAKCAFHSLLLRTAMHAAPFPLCNANYALVPSVTHNDPFTPSYCKLQCTQHLFPPQQRTLHLSPLCNANYALVPSVTHNDPFNPLNAHCNARSTFSHLSNARCTFPPLHGKQHLSLFTKKHKPSPCLQAQQSHHPFSLLHNFLYP